MIDRHISPAGLALIKQFEGCRLEAYQDAGGIWTIGYGHAIAVEPGLTISQADADCLLEQDISSAERCVDAKTGQLTQNQFDALVSFVFNVGCAAFNSSGLLMLLNAGQTSAAADEFPKWVHAGNPPQVVPGLVARRETERKLFLTP